MTAQVFQMPAAARVVLGVPTVADAAPLRDADPSRAASPSLAAVSVPAVGEGRPVVPLIALRRVVAEITADVAELDGAIAAGGVGEARLALYVGQVAAYRNVLVMLRDACGVES